jgi:class 3 adenylate cyclase/PAS domain-containing protein
MERGMTEATDTQTSALLEALAKAHQVAGDLRNVLRSQREMLRERGFSLPPGTTTALDEIIREIDGVQREVGNVEHERDQYRALADVAALINSSLDLTQVLNEVMDTIILLTGAERGYLMLRDDETGGLTFRIARNMDRETIDEKEFEVSRSVVGQVAQSGEAVLTADALDDQRLSAAESIISMRLRSILCVPLKLKGVVTGVIYTDNKIQRGVFDERTRDLLSAFSDQAAVAIENARLFESVKASLAAITEMKNLQDNVFASIVSGVITTDRDLCIALINRRAEEILGVEGSVGYPLYDVLPPLGPRFERLIEQVLEADEQLSGAEFETEIPGVGWVDLSFSFSPLKDAANQSQGVVVVLDDLTESKRREAQIAGVRRYLPAEVVDGIRTADGLKLGGTREVITILFADIRGFSTYSERLDPERLVEIINTYMTIAADAIHMHQGVIDKFMGDEVMALFNAPIRPQEDHALRAVRTACAMRSDIQAYHETVPSGDRLQFGIGVHTGEAIVGNVGSPDRLDYSAMGDSVNLAKRLQEVADPDQVLISEDTYNLVKDKVEVRQLEPIVVKGRSQQTRVYELLRVRG